MTTGFQQQSPNLAPTPRPAPRPQHIGQLAAKPRPEEPRSFPTAKT